jgi:HD-like signal output (HDOD) protein
LGAHDRAVLERAALEHHAPPVLCNSRKTARLLADLGFETCSDPVFEPDVIAVLASFHGVSEEGPSERVARLAALLETANWMDEAFETECLLPDEPVAENPLIVDALAKLRVLGDADVSASVCRFPVLPSIATAAIQTALSPAASTRDLLRVLRMDPLLAMQLIKVANSSLNCLMMPFRDIERAIIYVGDNTARGVLLAAAFRPLFRAGHLHALWHHSLRAAQTAQEIATLAGYPTPNEAFLAGIVHDIGSLLFSRLPLAIAQRFREVRQRGCPATHAEQVLAGFSHAEFGARALEAWKFHPSIVEAVAHHHRLQTGPSKLSAILYLTEHQLCSAEDMASPSRLQAALDATGLEMFQLEDLDRPRRGAPFRSLSFAA